MIGSMISVGSASSAGKQETVYSPLLAPNASGLTLKQDYRVRRNLAHVGLGLGFSDFWPGFRIKRKSDLTNKSEKSD